MMTFTKPVRPPLATPEPDSVHYPLQTPALLLQQCLNATNDTLFGCDLYEAGIAEKVIKMFKEMLEGPGAVRKVLKKYL